MKVIKHRAGHGGSTERSDRFPRVSLLDKKEVRGLAVRISAGRAFLAKGTNCTCKGPGARRDPGFPGPQDTRVARVERPRSIELIGIKLQAWKQEAETPRQRDSLQNVIKPAERQKRPFHNSTASSHSQEVHSRILVPSAHHEGI